MKKIFKAVFLLTIFSVLTRVLGFVFRIYLSRKLTTVDLGVYQMAVSVFAIFSTLVSSGLPLVISRNTSNYSTLNDKNSENRLMSASLITGIGLSIFSLFVVLIFKGAFISILKDNRIYVLLLILMPAILFSSIYSTFRGNMWGHKNFFGVCITELIEQTTRILTCFLLLSNLFNLKDKTIGVALSLSIACFISAIVSFLIYMAKGGKFKKPKNQLWLVLKTSTPISGMRILSSMVQPLITIIIPLRLMSAGLSETGALAEIGIVMGMTFPLLFIPSSIVGSLATALIPEISAHNTKGNKQNIIRDVKSGLMVSLICAFVLLPIYMGIGPAIGKFLYKNEQSGNYLIYFAFLMIPICLNSITSSALNSLGFETKTFKNYVVGAIGMILSFWILPKYIGVLALAVGMGFCLILSTHLNLKLISKTLDYKFKLKRKILVFALISVFLVFLNNFLFSILVKFLPLFISITASLAISVICYLILLDIASYIKIINMFVIIKAKLFKKRKKAMNIN